MKFVLFFIVEIKIVMSFGFNYIYCFTLKEPLSSLAEASRGEVKVSRELQKASTWCVASREITSLHRRSPYNDLKSTLNLYTQFSNSGFDCIYLRWYLCCVCHSGFDSIYEMLSVCVTLVLIVSVYLHVSQWFWLFMCICVCHSGFSAGMELALYEEEEPEPPPSRPLTPSEQTDIMLALEDEEESQQGLPSDRDLQVGTMGRDLQVGTL
jgi:hypothetical protein